MKTEHTLDKLKKLSREELISYGYTLNSYLTMFQQTPPINLSQFVEMQLSIVGELNISEEEKEDFRRALTEGLEIVSKHAREHKVEMENFLRRN